MSDLILEAGKRYVTRSGWITPPLEFDDEFLPDYPFLVDNNSYNCSIGIQSWTPNGKVSSGKQTDGADLVREYVPESSVPGVPEGWRVVRFGPIRMNEFWIPPSGIPIENTVPEEVAIVSPFHCLIVERIASA